MEFGLCEMLNSIAIRPEMAPKDGDFGFDLSQCEASLPAGTIDHSPHLVHNKVFFLICINFGHHSFAALKVTFISILLAANMGGDSSGGSKSIFKCYKSAC